MATVTKTITVTAINPFGQGKVGNVEFTIDGKAGKAKAYIDGCPPVGSTVTVEFEQKPPYSGNGPDETWIKVPKAGGGGRGGAPAKSDPEKNKVIAEANQNNNASMKFSNSLNNSVKLVEMGCLLVGKGGDVNQVRIISNDLATITLDIQKRLLNEE